MYDRILVPTDGSDYAEASAAAALELAKTMDATVDVICVVETGPLGSVALPGDTASADDVLSERGEEYVTQVADRAAELDVPVTTAVREGVPVREILDYADDVDVDVIVMGSRGRGGISRMMLGSVTEGVTRHSGRDVLVVSSDSGPVSTDQ
ncbi:universal stress protein [Natrarchaeobaculum sulfurireducens]|uniref:Nucleotide-binding protein, UspA family n=1 Tax=Natrarchaeobaculum sulfurireducens TaxID=2044521 RepID=A0A346PD36_9EURY|nr:universal stress protein [Natrarchaeobaculum sulfurireducens]AXR77431.1 Nucleotide-binding protein, UspA family [Natrarchaeobaculum sulfurireducens]